MRRQLTALVVLGSAVGLLTVVPALPAAAAAEPARIIVADQGTSPGRVKGQRVSVLEQNADWNSPVAEVWKWEVPERTRWRGITDAKVRTERDGRRVVLVSSGGGNVAKIDWDSRKPIWQAQVPAGDNTHSIELLPDGQIVTAGSGGYLRFFPAGATKYTRTYSLPGAHGVLYNDNRLWALGYGELRQYDIRKNRLVEADPTIRRIGNGHDLALIHGTPKHEMWLTNTNNVYRYDKYSGKRPQRVTGPHGGAKVKSIGNQPDGTILLTRQPKSPTGECPHSYQAPKVDLYDATGGEHRTKARKGSCFYKARPVVWTYY
ncbi:DUF6528 family protein [Amycolatopsis sp. 195334CR]|uniref:DUF6528 family protein n=1 Tax=Amycolatopsis sp. 195334CR TaxID=2814588 RepID=UPI001A8FA71F|nr:DUF6528 family protein [Amycolatopsis sp. 195334CR]MBN6039925.1 hypothetical protein [Amycolatopsis sp. 195334CR]